MNSDRISFRLSPEALFNLQAFTKATGKKPSEIARAGLEIYMAQCGWRIQSNVGQVSDSCPTNKRVKKVPNVGQVSDNPRVHAGDTNLDLSKDKSSSPTNNKKILVQSWFKKFWVHCDNNLFPKRVIKTISENWEDLKGLAPESVAKKYNAYCNGEAMKNKHYKEPNSWLNDGGYENEIKEENNNGGDLAYDIE
jgi:hypothetical protein